jgi:hypothetical protein
MKELDHEIEEVERRLAHRRQVLDATAQEAARRTKTTLKRTATSPPVLIGVAVLGFLVGGGILRGRKRPRYPERRRKEAQAAKKTGIAGVLMTGAMWLVKSQLGNPATIAQLIMSRMKKGAGPTTQWSPPGDTRGKRFTQSSRPAQTFR